MKRNARLAEQTICLILALAIYVDAAAPGFADEPLKGQVEQAEVLPESSTPPPPAMESMPVPVPRRKRPLRGSVKQDSLQGKTQGAGLTGGVQDGGWGGSSQQGAAGQWQSDPLQGGATQNPMALNVTNDPDAGNQELQIEWDTWRNGLMQAIQQGTLAKINIHNDVHFVWDPHAQMMVSRYPNGTAAWYAIDVLPSRRIVNIRLTSSSRYPSYDQAVLEAINDLQGNRILTYPRGSRRTIVSQESSVRTAGQSSSQDYQWGDVERQRY